MTAKTKSAAIVGMGHTGCSVARFLGRQHVVCEAYDEHKVKLPKDVSIPLHIGTLQADKLAAHQMIVASPGVSWQHPALVGARKAGVRLIGDLDLFLEHFKGELLAVTGTNGKTTTVAMIGTLLEVLPGGIELGGNIGVPMLDLLDKDREPPRVALELSSFQLERAEQVHPKWAVLLNLQPDHADQHGDAEQYRQAKLRLFASQSEGDTAMLPMDGCWDDLGDELKGRGVRIWRFGRVRSCKEADAGLVIADDGSVNLFWSHDGKKSQVNCKHIHVHGYHQQLNLSVAAQAASDFGVSAAVIREAVTSFKGLPHRMQALGVLFGRQWFDDSKATNPDAAVAALDSFDQVLWICGGLRKGLDLEPLTASVSKHVAHAFIIGKDREPFAAMLKAAGVEFSMAGNIKRAVAMAAEQQSDIPVLLSPAAASQDQFQDYAERGRAFATAVKTLRKAA